jgi:hypothetical protein
MIGQMPNPEQQLTRVFRTLSDPTRRAAIERPTRGSAARLEALDEFLATLKEPKG